MSISLDPRDVLQHLNSLGYRNITADELKAFIKDLKKLIKYDLQKSGDKENCPSTCRSSKCETCQQLSQGGQQISKRSFKLPYQAPTQSYLQKCSHKSKPSKKQDDLLPALLPSRLNSAAQRDVETGRCKMWIRPQQPHRTIKSDPVALYYNYVKDWAKFRNKIPGENQHLDLRWAVRERLASNNNN